MVMNRIRRGDERGMVTIEIAIGVLTLGILACFLGWIIHLAALQAQCFETAAQVARQVARGDEASAQRAKETAPQGARVSVQIQGEDVQASVRLETALFGVGPIPVEAVATCPREPGAR